MDPPEPTSAAAAVELRLLGRPLAHGADGPVELPDGLPQRLLAVLAYRGTWIARDELGALLWPDFDVDRRRANLRRVLGRARRLPVAAGIDADRDRLRLRCANDVAIVLDDAAPAAARLAAWSGTLLEGFAADEDEPFGAWLAEERRRLAAVRRALLLRRSREVEDHDPDAASTLAAAALDLDPLDEEAVQRYMAAAARAGNEAEARNAFRAFAAALDAELGLAPLEATRALAAHLERGATAAGGTAPADAPAGTGGGAVPVAVLAAGGQAPLVGRGALLARVRATRVPLVVLTGEAGIGKTTVAAAAAGDGAAWLRGDTDERGRPFAAVASLLRTAWADPAARLRLRHLDRATRIALGQLLPGLTSQATSLAPPSRPNGDPREQRWRLVEAAARALDTLLPATATLLIDDLHALDPDSLEVVDRWTQRVASDRMRPLAIATLREDALANAPEVRARLDAWTAEGRCERVPVAPWDEVGVLALVEALSGHVGGAPFARRLHAATGGHPLFVLETLRHLFEAGELWVEPGGGWATAYDDATTDYAELPVPAGVRQAAGERVERLDDATRRLLEAACLAVPPFTLEHLGPATALAPWQALDALERAAAGGFLEPSGEGYRFSHELLRRAVEARLRPERRALIEQRLAWALERARGAPSLIASHFDRAGRRADAVRWHRRAATDAAQLYSLDTALEHLDRARELSADDAERLEIALQRADLCDQTIDHHGEEAAIAEARAAAARLGDPRAMARVELAEGNRFAYLGRREEAAAAARAALALVGDGDLAARAHLQLGGVQVATGALDEALGSFAAAQAALPPGPSTLRGDVHLKGLFQRALHRGDLGEAQRQVDLATAVYEAVGAHDRLTDTSAYRGWLRMHRGDAAGARSDFERSLEAARDGGSVAMQRRALLNLIKLHTDVADAEAAVPLVAEGLALASGFEHPTTAVAFLQADGYVRYLRGDLGGALTAFERAIQQADASGDVLWRAQARPLPLDLRLHLGDTATARALLDEMRALVDAHDLGLARPAWRVRAAHLALAEGDPEAARTDMTALLADETVPHEQRGEAGVALALAHDRLGDPRAALDALAACRGAPTFEVALRALALELQARTALGQAAPGLVADARSRLASGRLVPFEGLALRRALAAHLDAFGDGDAAAALRAEADAQEAGLRAGLGTPAVQPRR